MTYVSYFEAEDGTRFEDEFECQQYENELLSDEIRPFITALNCEKEPVNDFLDKAEIFYLNLKNDKAVQWWKKNNDEDLEKPGLYYWCNNNDWWISYDDEIRRLEDEKKEIEKIS